MTLPCAARAMRSASVDMGFSARKKILPNGDIIALGHPGHTVVVVVVSGMESKKLVKRPESPWLHYGWVPGAHGDSRPVVGGAGYLNIWLKLWSEQNANS